jgi:hypothetical protein
MTLNSVGLRGSDKSKISPVIFRQGSGSEATKSMKGPRERLERADHPRRAHLEDARHYG